MIRNDEYYNIIWDYGNDPYANKIGRSAAKKWSGKFTDAQLISVIKQGRKTDYFNKETDLLTWDIIYDIAKHSPEYNYAVDNFTKHIKATAFKRYGKKQLKLLFGNLSDEKLLNEVVDLVMTGYMTDDMYPYESIDYEFEYIISLRLKNIGKKLREQKRKQKITAYKKQYLKKTVKRAVTGRAHKRK